MRRPMATRRPRTDDERSIAALPTCAPSRARRRIVASKSSARASIGWPRRSRKPASKTRRARFAPRPIARSSGRGNSKRSGSRVTRIAPIAQRDPRRLRRVRCAGDASRRRARADGRRAAGMDGVQQRTLEALRNDCTDAHSAGRLHVEPVARSLSSAERAHCLDRAGPRRHRPVDRRVQSDARSLAEQLRAGEISLRAWEAEMRVVVKDSQLLGASSAVGGWAQLDQRSLGRAGQSIRTQYEFLDQFAIDVMRGKQNSTAR
jgi:hypothetical protein